MTHALPIPPGNQPPYPTIEPPHPQPVRAAPSAESSVADKARDLAPKLIVGVVVAGAAAVAATVLARSRRATESTPTKRPRKAAKPPAPAKATAPKTRSPKPKAAKASPATGQRGRRTSGDDKAKRRPQDASRIAMGEDYEVRYWTRKFGVGRDELQRAVDAVGNGAAAVEHELGKA